MAQARISRGSLIFVTLVLIGVALLAFIIIFDRQTGLAYTITFEDAENLPPGAPVRMQGIQIGEVTDVELNEDSSGVEVEVKIYPQHRDRIYAPPNTTARIKSDALVLGTPYVEVYNRGEPGGGMQSGAVVKGLDGWTEEKLWLAKGRFGESWEQMLVTSKQHLDRLEEWAQTGEGARMKESVEEYLASLETAASGKAETAREKLSEAMERGGVLWKQLKDEKAPEAAEEVRKSLEGLLEQSETLSKDARDELERVMESMDVPAVDVDVISIEKEDGVTTPATP